MKCGELLNQPRLQGNRGNQYSVRVPQDQLSESSMIGHSSNLDSPWNVHEHVGNDKILISPECSSL